MSRVFAYCRVSTLEQTTENQRREIEAAGFAIRSQRLIEGVSLDIENYCTVSLFFEQTYL